jgi:hypothetical protein
LAQRASGKKKRKSRPAPAAAAAPAQKPPSRTEAKNAAAREQLQPLAPGERPKAVTVAAVVAVCLVLVQIPLYFIWEGDERPAPVSFAFFCVLMLVMAWGMWNARYWAVLGFQALVALAIVAGSLSLLVASDLTAVLVCLAIIIPSGTLFFFLVKAMARIQMPQR